MSGTSLLTVLNHLLVDTGKQEYVSLNGRVEISAVDIFCLLVRVILVAISAQEVIGWKSIWFHPELLCL